MEAAAACRLSCICQLPRSHLVSLYSSFPLFFVWFWPSLSFPSSSHNSLPSRTLNLYPRAFSESSFSFTAMEEQHYFQTSIQPLGFIFLQLYCNEKKNVRGKGKAPPRIFNMPPTCLNGLNMSVWLESLCGLM